jgi:type IV secretory pathway VirJ component
MILRIVLPIAFFLNFTLPPSTTAETLEYGRFGTLNLYRTTTHPSRLVLFVSGDGGWNQGVVDMARALADADALVVGIDINTYLKRIVESPETCAYCAADFEALGKFVQKKLGFPNFVQPALVGYSSGATLVYAVLGQSPANTFGGALSMGFCPDLTLAKPLCRSNGLAWQQDPKQKTLYRFPPFQHLRNPWVAFQGTIDKVCDPRQTEAFVRLVSGGRLVSLPGVGHGFSVPKNWMPQFKKAIADLTAPPAEPPAVHGGDLGDLPLVEVPAAGSDSKQLVVFLTGDGGWAGLDQEVSRELADRGLPVVGLNSLKYFWSPRTPEGATADLARILRYYLGRWQKDSAVLMGYSFGADVLPFMAARLPQELRARTALIALLGPGRQTSFEFHLSDWLGGLQKGLQPVQPEVEHLSGTNLLCLYGREENDSLCPSIHQPGAKVIALEGAHHFSGNYAAIAKHVLTALEQ